MALSTALIGITPTSLMFFLPLALGIPMLSPVMENHHIRLSRHTQLKKQIAEERAAEEQDQEETKESAGLDMDADGDVELNECDERKHRHGMTR